MRLVDFTATSLVRLSTVQALGTLSLIIPPVLVRRNSTTARKVGLSLALVHLVAFSALALYIRRSADPQAPLLWAGFAVIDFPLSLIYFLARNFCWPSLIIEQSWLAEILYLPHFVHGLLGTIGWYMLPRFVTSRRLGGVW